MKRLLAIFLFLISTIVFSAGEFDRLLITESATIPIINGNLSITGSVSMTGIDTASTSKTSYITLIDDELWLAPVAIDINVNNPTQDQILTYSATADQWINTINQVFTLSINDLIDVSATPPNTSDLLAFDGSNWVNSSTASLTALDVSGLSNLEEIDTDNVIQLEVGTNNVGVGEFAFNALSPLNGVFNTAFGYAAANRITNGDLNSCFGHSSCFNTLDDMGNTAIGTSGLYNQRGGDYNTSLGFEAGYSTGGVSANNYNIFIGSYSGKYINDSVTTRLDNNLIIDSLDRTDVDGVFNKSLIVGSMNTATESQNLLINGSLTVDGTAEMTNIQLSTTASNPAYSEALLFYDAAKKAVSYYNEESDVTVNLGRELLLRVYNNTGSVIPNCTVVYPMGNVGGVPAIALADANFEEKSKIVGITTQEIGIESIGYVTKFGQIAECDTNVYTGGDKLYLSETPGEYTSTKPTGGSFVTTVGVVEIVGTSTGSIVADIVASQLAVEVTNTNGFPPTQRVGTTLSIDSGTRTFTIAPTATDYHYYEDGQKYEKTSSENVVFSASEGLHVIYYNEETLTSLPNPTEGEIATLIRTKPLVAYLYWDATNNVYNYFGDERHDISMSPSTHLYNHFTRGFQYLSGLGLADFDADCAITSLPSCYQYSVSSGFAVDEDIITSYSATASTTGSPVYYLDGAANMRRAFVSGQYALSDTDLGVGATDYIAYNLDTAGTWSQVAVPNNQFVLYHQVVINGVSGEDQQITLMGQNVYLSLNDARAGATTEIATIQSQLPLEELGFVGTIIYEAKSTFLNDLHARIRTTDTGENYVDWRTSELAQGVAPSSHNNLTNLEKAQGGVEWGHIDDSTQSIAGLKTFGNNLTVNASFSVTNNATISGVLYVGDDLTIGDTLFLNQDPTTVSTQSLVLSVVDGEVVQSPNGGGAALSMAMQHLKLNSAGGDVIGDGSFANVYYFSETTTDTGTGYFTATSSATMGTIITFTASDIHVTGSVTIINDEGSDTVCAVRNANYATDCTAQAIQSATSGIIAAEHINTGDPGTMAIDEIFNTGQTLSILTTNKRTCGAACDEFWNLSITAKKKIDSTP